MQRPAAAGDKKNGKWMQLAPWQTCSATVGAAMARDRPM
jgi:hypothetical protein